MADLIMMEVLDRFIHPCITWLERVEVEEREGVISEDRGVQNVWFPLFALGTLYSDTPSIALPLLHVSCQVIDRR